MRNDIPFCPSEIAVIGGGRWARVIIETLCRVVPQPVKISIHSASNTAAMASWAKALGSDCQISVTSDFPTFCSMGNSAVIVVNAARNHEIATRWALSEGIPVLVEKPVTLSEDATQSLIALAELHAGRLAAAHVFLYAGYIDNFSQYVTHSGLIQSISLSWVDIKSESRYGERKTYDPGLAVYKDCLPHALSILGRLLPGRRVECESVTVARGGARVEIKLVLGDIPCKVCLERNGEQRQRVVEVTTLNDILCLDFSEEPGLIRVRGDEVVGDESWGENPRPLAQMLSAFLQWAAGGYFDRRLNVAVGLEANRVIDYVEEKYIAQMKGWFIETLSSDKQNADDVSYAFTEIVNSCEDTRHPEMKAGQIEIMSRRFPAMASDVRWQVALASVGSASGLRNFMFRSLME